MTPVAHVEAGQGIPIVHFQGPGVPCLTPAHDLLSRRFRVLAFAVPASGRPRDNATTLAGAIDALGLDTFNLMGSSVGSETALWLTLQVPQRVLALVLEAPTVIGAGAGDAGLEPRLPGIATPTLVLFGTRDDVTATATGRVYKARMPGCHLVFVYDAGHAIGADRPAAFAEVVTDFFERREAFVVSRTATVIHP